MPSFRKSPSVLVLTSSPSLDLSPAFFFRSRWQRRIENQGTTRTEKPAKGGALPTTADHHLPLPFPPFPSPPPPSNTSSTPKLWTQKPPPPCILSLLHRWDPNKSSQKRRPPMACTGTRLHHLFSGCQHACKLSFPGQINRSS